MQKELSELTVNQLKEIARDFDLKGRSSPKNKKEMVAFIMKAYLNKSRSDKKIAKTKLEQKIKEKAKASKRKTPKKRRKTPKTKRGKTPKGKKGRRKSAKKIDSDDLYDYNKDSVRRVARYFDISKPKSYKKKALITKIEKGHSKAEIKKALKSVDAELLKRRSPVRRRKGVELKAFSGSTDLYDYNKENVRKVASVLGVERYTRLGGKKDLIKKIEKDYSKSQIKNALGHVQPEPLKRKSPVNRR